MKNTRSSTVKVKSPEIYIPLLTEQQQFTVQSGVLISISSRQCSTLGGHPLPEQTTNEIQTPKTPEAVHTPELKLTLTELNHFCQQLTKMKQIFVPVARTAAQINTLTSRKQS